MLSWMTLWILILPHWGLILDTRWKVIILLSPWWCFIVFPNLGHREVPTSLSPIGKSINSGEAELQCHLPSFILSHLESDSVNVFPVFFPSFVLSSLYPTLVFHCTLSKSKEMITVFNNIWVLPPGIQNREIGNWKYYAPLFLLEDLCSFFPSNVPVISPAPFFSLQPCSSIRSDSAKGDVVRRWCAQVWKDG